MEYDYSNNRYLNHNCPVHTVSEPATCYTCYEASVYPQPPVFYARMDKESTRSSYRVSISAPPVSPTDAAAPSLPLSPTASIPLSPTASIPPSPSMPTFPSVTSSLPRPIFLDPFTQSTFPIYLRVAPRVWVNRPPRVNEAAMNFGDHRTDFWGADGQWLGSEEYSEGKEAGRRTQRMIRDDKQQLDHWKTFEAWKGEDAGWAPDETVQKAKRKRSLDKLDGAREEVVDKYVEELDREIEQLEAEERAWKRQRVEDLEKLEELEELNKELGSE